MEEITKLTLIQVLQLCEIIGYLEATKLNVAKQYAQFLRAIIGKTPYGEYLWNGGEVYANCNTDTAKD